MSLLKKNKTNKEPRDLSILFPVLFSVIMICALVGVGTYVYSTVRNHDRRVINEMYASSTKIEIIETGEYVEEYPEITMRVYVSNEKCDCPEVTEQKSLEYYISTLENMLYDSGYEKNDVVLLERRKETDYEEKESAGRFACRSHDSDLGGRTRASEDSGGGGRQSGGVVFL